ncbi:MAG: SPOR domain-containing protein [Acidobacteria bacterium]|nr:SPOR domain-containing protein [Acidobacteriota bacterium]
MPRNEEGEFELVLGNRQVLSVFFVVVILMGVCFAAGYIFGRNSAAGSPDAARAKKGAESAIVIDPTMPEGKGDLRSSPAPGQVEVRTPGAAALPEKAAEKPEKPAPAPPPPVVAAVKPPPAAPAPAGLIEPATGQTYLQVAAVRRPDAGTLVSELKKKDFAASVAAGPNETLFRVLVGPLADSADVNKNRARLKELGFDPIVKRF